MRVKSTLSLTNRLESLKRLHRSLDEKIARAQNHPLTNERQLSELESLKLKSEDEITVLESILVSVENKQPATAA